MSPVQGRSRIACSSGNYRFNPGHPHFLLGITMSALYKPIPYLHAVVAEAYRAFGHHKAPNHPLDACPCCMSPALEQQMREWPLRQLTSDHFYQYNSAAASTEQPVDELKYLLPRLLELMAEGAYLHHSTELNLVRLGRCSPGSFTKAEQAVLDQFTLAYFSTGLDRSEGWDGWSSDALSVLLTMHIGGLDIAPLLAHWLDREDLQSTLHYVKATYWDFWHNRRLIKAFASDRPDYRTQVTQWLLTPEHRQRFAERLLKPDFLRLAEQQPKTACIPFKYVVDMMFDALTT